MKLNPSLIRSILVLGLLGCLPAQAQLLYDPFSYPVGNTLGSNGWSLSASSGGVATNVVNQNLSKPGFAPTTGNAVQLRPNGQDWYHTFADQTHTTSDNATLYFSLLLRVDNLGLLDTTGGYFAGLGSSTGGALAAAIGLRKSGSGFQIGIAKRDYSTLNYDSNVYTVGETVLVVGSYNWVSGDLQNDFVNLWINPSNLGAASAPAASISASATGSTTDLATFASLALKPQGGAASTQIPASLIVDEIRVGTTWASVTPIPEPSVIALLGLGLAAGFALKRRKQSAPLA